MTDFRALCAELVEYLALLDEPPGELVVRAQVALAEPQPAADGEVAATGKSGLQDGPAVQSREPASVAEQPSDEELASIYHENCRGCEFMDQVGFEDAARAILARWGTPNLAETRSSLEPIPVSERLRQMEDLAADAMAGLRYIEHWHGRLSGVGWARLHEKAARLNPTHALPLPKEVE
jgi:hypothetical protein